VREHTDTANTDSDQDTETDPAEGEAKEPTQAASADKEVDQKPRRVDPAKNGRRRGRGVKGRLRAMTKPLSDDADVEPVQEDMGDTAGAKKPTDADADTPTDTTAEAGGAEDTQEAEPPTTGDAEPAGDQGPDGEPVRAERRIDWSRMLAYGVLPALALVLALVAGFLKWQDASARSSQAARADSLAAAKDSTVAMLSYKSETVEQDFGAVQDRLTGAFKQAYTQLTNDVVIPGAKQRHISSTATVPDAAPVSATYNHAVALLFVNQTAVVDKDPPASTGSSVRVTLDKVAGRWLVSGFDPI
jgi:Mce-associated membrane protein